VCVVLIVGSPGCIVNMKKKHNTVLSSQGSSYGENFLGIPPKAPVSSGGVLLTDRWLARFLLSAVGNPPIAFILWNGESVCPDNVTPLGKLIIRNRKALYRLLLHPDLNFGDLFCNGDIEVIGGSLPEFLQRVYLSRLNNKTSLLTKILPALGNFARRSNAPVNSRQNIHHHYDIGNEFYRLWLDADYMQYTCAYYPDQGMTLEQAQAAKLHHICRKLQLRPGQNVVEAGCGWGSLALFMAMEYGVNVTAYNISREQISYARKKVREMGLDNRVTFVEDDYRNIDGKYDVFVSVGMLEHVGVDNYRALGSVIDKCLDKKHGIGLIHTIGRNRPALMNAWIEARIFPGGCPPSLGQMMDIFEGSPFSILDVENLRLHYARTLEHWLQRYEQNAETVTSMYDETFVRAWRLYLSGSIAAFSSGQLQLFQVVFTRPQNNRLPWSRIHLYR